jgi:threonine dehydrogenase-like Zn-dependent dehydrogenase
VRVRFLYCGLCGSDISHFEGRPDVSYPITVGHEFVAEVVGLGDGVNDLALEDIVTSDLNFRCGECDHCLARRSHLCRTGQRGEFTNRGFADLGDLRRSYLLRIDGPPTRQMTLTEPLSCVLHAKQWASLGADDRVLVIGAGSIGLCMSFALSKERPYPAFHVTDEIPSRLRLVDEALGSCGHAQADPEGEYDVVFDVSGTEQGLRKACDHVRAGGRLCSMSHPNVDPISPFLVGEILRRDVTFTVSYLNGEWENMRTAAQLLEQHWTPAWDQAIEVIPIDRLQEAHENRHASPWCKTVIEIASDEP